MYGHGRRPSLGERPMVFWTIWRPHLTTAISISVRIAGVGLYLGALLAAAWAIALASGPHAYAAFKALQIRGHDTYPPDARAFAPSPKAAADEPAAETASDAGDEVVFPGRG